MSAFQNVLFDLDGTLVDSSEGIFGGIDYVYARLSLPAPSPELKRNFIGPPLQDSFVLHANLSPEEAQNAVKIFREYYSREGVHQNTLYSGIVPLLEDLKASGHSLYIATSKDEEAALRIIEQYQLLSYFDGLCGATKDGSRVQKVDVIRHLLAQAPQIDPSQSVMIGDREHDILGSTAMGIPCIAVLYGFGSQQEFEEAGAWKIASSPNGVGEIINRS